jgi:hypothetical protein
MLKIDSLCSICYVREMTKKDYTRKKYALLPPKIVEYEFWLIVCVNLVRAFTIRTAAKTNSLLVLTMIDPATGWIEIVEAKNKSATNNIHPGFVPFTFIQYYLSFYHIQLGKVFTI